MSRSTDPVTEPEMLNTATSKPADTPITTRDIMVRARCTSSSPILNSRSRSQAAPIMR